MLEEQSKRFQDTFIIALIVWPEKDRCKTLIPLSKYIFAILYIEEENLRSSGLGQV